MKKLYLYNQPSDFNQELILAKLNYLEIEKRASFSTIELDGVNIFFIQNLAEINSIQIHAKWLREFNKNIVILDKSIDFKDISLELIAFKFYWQNFSLDCLAFDVEYLLKSTLFLDNQENLKHLIIGRILDYILHDLNNPLTSVNLTIQLVTEMLNLDMEYRDEEQVKGFLNGIMEQLDKASEISKNVVKFGNMTHSDKELFIILDVLNHVLSLIKPVIRKQQIDFTYTQIDTLAFAHIDDFSFIMLILLFIYTFYLPKKSKFELIIEKHRIIFKSEKQIQSLNDLLANSEIPPCYLLNVFKNLNPENHFEFQIENANLCLMFKNSPK